MAASVNSLSMPFLYPCLQPGRLAPQRILHICSSATVSARTRSPFACSNRRPRHRNLVTEASLPPLPVQHERRSSRSHQSTSTDSDTLSDDVSPTEYPHLAPAPDDYSRSIFTDFCELTIHAGSGGHGCVSFLREKYISEGPANGGDGGTGGNVYISAVTEEKSLHKIARRLTVKAGRGSNGMGKSRGGQRGDDVVLEVPVGTVVTELARWDPVDEAQREYDEAERLEEKEPIPEEFEPRDGSARERADGFGKDAEIEGLRPGKRRDIEGDQRGKWRRDRWLLQPSSLPSAYATADFPALPRPRRSNIAANQPRSPILLDLSKPTSSPILLAAGAMGGLGNPHFATKSIMRPFYATKGDSGMRLKIHLELKLLADLGFVGLPNAGKSTLLRALSNSRARVGNWAFTTLTPNIGTVVLDDSHGRAKFDIRDSDGKRRTSITVADIPGLVVGAHQDRGLGLDFLRHVERAKVLAFVIDLAAGDAVEALKGLWQELGMYEGLREREYHERSQDRLVDWKALGSPVVDANASDSALTRDNQPVMWRSTKQGLAPVIRFQPISEKAWYVVATKADLADTQENFQKLRDYVGQVSDGSVEHPGPAVRNQRWKGRIQAIPISAIHAHGVEGIIEHTAKLLAGRQ